MLFFASCVILPKHLYNITRYIKTKCINSLFCHIWPQPNGKHAFPLQFSNNILMRSLIPPVVCFVDSDEIQDLCGVRTEVAADSNSAPDH